MLIIYLFKMLGGTNGGATKNESTMGQISPPNMEPECLSIEDFFSSVYNVPLGQVDSQHLGVQAGGSAKCK